MHSVILFVTEPFSDPLYKYTFKKGRKRRNMKQSIRRTKSRQGREGRKEGGRKEVKRKEGGRKGVKRKAEAEKERGGIV